MTYRSLFLLTAQ